MYPDRQLPQPLLLARHDMHSWHLSVRPILRQHHPLLPRLHRRSRRHRHGLDARDAQRPAAARLELLAAPLAQRPLVRRVRAEEGVQLRPAELGHLRARPEQAAVGRIVRLVGANLDPAGCGTHAALRDGDEGREGDAVLGDGGGDVFRGLDELEDEVAEGDGAAGETLRDGAKGPCYGEAGAVDEFVVYDAGIGGAQVDVINGVEDRGHDEILSVQVLRRVRRTVE